MDTEILIKRILLDTDTYIRENHENRFDSVSESYYVIISLISNLVVKQISIQPNVGLAGTSVFTVIHNKITDEVFRINEITEVEVYYSLDDYLKMMATKSGLSEPKVSVKNIGLFSTAIQDDLINHLRSKYRKLKIDKLL